MAPHLVKLVRRTGSELFLLTTLQQIGAFCHTPYFTPFLDIFKCYFQFSENFYFFRLSL
ncbi:hypothetical protein STRDD11_02374 [Streptococcus sp. DD11]|nr:hypothetical protein STRDD11_02374 [Streptococcus sp. DD11]